MFYLSRAEQVALIVLLVLLAAGIGVLSYHRGARAGLGGDGGPIFVTAPQPAGEPASPLPAQEAPAGIAPSAPDEPRPAAGAAAPERTEPRPRQRISLNAATLEQLDSLPGIGPVYAQNIIDYRERKRREQGRGFESVDELLNVPGIGPKRLTALRDYVAP